MHRHGYKGRKFGREKDQRTALMKGLAESLIKYEAVETTLPRAKELSSYVEKLITKAKKGDLHNRRQVMAKLSTQESANKLVDDLAPKLSDRNSGYLRVKRTKVRRGDGAQLARVSFVDNLAKTKSAPKTAAQPKSEADKPKEKKVTAEKRPTVRQAKSRSTGAQSQATRRTGIRGNK